MSEVPAADRVRTRIWQELAEPDDDFATRAALCRGYDVFGEMVGHARWVEMLLLLLRGDAPSAGEAELLEALAVALANAGPRDASTHAAMCAGAGGSTSASALMAALAVAAGRQGGAREVHDAMRWWIACGDDLPKWLSALRREAQPSVAAVWPESQGVPGFELHRQRSTLVVRQLLQTLAQRSSGRCLPWLLEHRHLVEEVGGKGLTFVGVAAAAFTDLRLTPDQAEMLWLLLRLPGAAAHALEQRQVGYRGFPFFSLRLQDDPGEATA